MTDSLARRGERRFAALLRSTLAIALVLLLGSCAVIERSPVGEEESLRRAVLLVQEVKAFGKSLGIEPTDALAESTLDRPGRSMLWLWMQKRGTIALQSPIDIRLWLRFGGTKEQLPLERLFNISDYSIYFRQGNQFGDRRSATTSDFAREQVATLVMVVLHEDLHDQRNFDLPWESEESLVTPLGKLAALKYFEHKSDAKNVQVLLADLEREEILSQELNAFAREAEQLFRTRPLEDARKAVVHRLPSYPAYRRHYRFQLGDQDPLAALEAKLSHDLAYYRHYHAITSLYRKTNDLGTLIQELKKIPKNTGPGQLKDYLDKLDNRFRRPPG